MINCSTTTSAVSGSSMWQLGPELPHAIDYTDEHKTWRSAALRLAFDNQLRITERINENGDDDIDDHYRKTRFIDMPMKNLEMKIHQQHHHHSWYGVQQSTADKWYKTLPAAEMLPRNEILGGYIFVCNNETMQEDLRRQLFGLSQKYKDSVRAITPGLPLFLYNYTAHQLHGVFQAVSFGGLNIDPTAWEDKKCRGESRFPAQVRIRIKKKCQPLEEDAFRPILYHYDGPKFRLQLSVPEALALLDLFKEEDL